MLQDKIQIYFWVQSDFLVHVQKFNKRKILAISLSIFTYLSNTHSLKNVLMSNYIQNTLNIRESNLGTEKKKSMT